MECFVCYKMLLPIAPTEHSNQRHLYVNGSMHACMLDQVGGRKGREGGREGGRERGGEERREGGGEERREGNETNMHFPLHTS